MNAFDYFFENTWNLQKKFLYGKEEISFQELYQSTLSLSEYLRNSIGEGKNVLLISANSRFFIIVYLAIIKSGNICIPLDTLIEKDSLHYIKELTKPSLAFLTEDIKIRLLFNDTKTILPDDLSKFQKTIEQKTISTFDSEKCAEIIFTSGSTGEPKGVMISHKNIIANTQSILEYLKLNQNDRMLVVLPFYYCYGLSLLHTHLRVGGSIGINNSFMFLGTVINNLIEYKCTGFAGVPSHFQVLLRKSLTFKNTKFPDLRYVTQAGGKLASVFIDEFLQNFPDVKFYVMYGQTEATARLSYLPPELWKEKKGSIGKGIPGVELEVVNEYGENIKPGETGEVIARGNNIMIGYYADKKGTKNIVKNGWLYTGDLGTVDSDGFIYLTARKKEIIKAGGKRISPKEIEAVILEIPEIVDCSVEGVDDQLLGEILKATIVINNENGRRINEELIKQHCSKYLALYKIPQIFEFKENITISATGKRIKKLL
jgi:acyl-CoA synthetase (AMP-forming)/AMP-acid ligase II